MIPMLLNLFMIQGALGFQVPLQLSNPLQYSSSAAPMIYPSATTAAATSNLFQARSCTHGSCLNMAEEPNDDAIQETDADTAAAAAEAKLAKKLKGRKKQVIGGNKITMTAYTIFSIFGTLQVPQAFYSPLQFPRLFITSGPLLAAGFAYILIGAAENNRLTSDTYKRLNLALIEYGFISFIVGVISKVSASWNIVAFITFVNSIKGYGYGLKGWELVPTSAKKDFTDGMKSNFDTMTKIPNVKSAGYLAATLTVLSLKLVKFMEVMKGVIAGEASYRLSINLFRLSIYMMMTITVFTLKDAADRDRLEGTTFIELNALATFAFAAWAKNVGIGTPFGQAIAAFSAFSGFNGVSSVLKKKKK